MWLEYEGYQVTLGEAWRSSDKNAAYALQGKGIANSNHIKRLAIDLNIFKDGKLLSTFEEYKEIGKKWEEMEHPQYKACWGGRFKSLDMNHFSFEDNGVR